MTGVLPGPTQSPPTATSRNTPGLGGTPHPCTFCVCACASACLRFRMSISVSMQGGACVRVRACASASVGVRLVGCSVAPFFLVLTHARWQNKHHRVPHRMLASLHSCVFMRGHRVRVRVRVQLERSGCVDRVIARHCGAPDPSAITCADELVVDNGGTAGDRLKHSQPVRLRP